MIKLVIPLHNSRAHVKNTFWPDVGVVFKILILEILQSVRGNFS